MSNYIGPIIGGLLAVVGSWLATRHTNAQFFGGLVQKVNDHDRRLDIVEAKSDRHSEDIAALKATRSRAEARS